MSKNDSVAAMYNRMPMVAALNKVPGFNPMKLLRRTVSSKTGEEVFKLDLQYKKLWFRLTHPEGRIKLKPLRITEQLAIYEAQVFLSREDDEPVSNFTSSILRTEAPNGQYVQAAQEEAVDKALTDAGFGIQLSDVSIPESERHFGCEVPVQAMYEVADAVKNAPKQQPEVKPPVQRTAVTEKPSVQPADLVQKKEQPAVVKTAVNTAPQGIAPQMEKIIDAEPAGETVRKVETVSAVQPQAQVISHLGSWMWWNCCKSEYVADRPRACMLIVHSVMTGEERCTFMWVRIHGIAITVKRAEECWACTQECTIPTPPMPSGKYVMP